MLEIIKNYDPQFARCLLSVYKDCKWLGYSDQILYLYNETNETVDRYLFENHKSICKEKAQNKEGD